MIEVGRWLIFTFIELMALHVLREVPGSLSPGNTTKHLSNKTMKTVSLVLFAHQEPGYKARRQLYVKAATLQEVAMATIYLSTVLFTSSQPERIHLPLPEDGEGLRSLITLMTSG